MGHAATAPTVKCKNIFGQPLSIFGVPVDREMIFANHRGVYDKGMEKRQRRLIIKSTFIKFFMDSGEQIRCLTTGCSPVSTLDQVLTGPGFLLLKRAIFIFTDKRILHIPTRLDRSPRGAVSQILYQDCAHIDLKGRTLNVAYKNGTQEAFHYLGRRERRKIQSLLAELPNSPKTAGHFQGRVHLCPSCATILPDAGIACQACKIKFKSRSQAKLRALLIPGGGFFYCCYPILGTMTALFEIVLMGAALIMLISSGSGLAEKVGFLAAFVMLLAIVKTVSTYHAVQQISDFVPEQQDYAMRKV
ncbi:MAG: hypothetical protein HKP58_13600 [Desulfatitalea sp.]|nr:hypothetical protein [Desulfatitalea sp.]NNK01436.1 hypothetical protein [Desulfatitalea sp.]